MTMIRISQIAHRCDVRPTARPRARAPVAGAVISAGRRGGRGRYGPAPPPRGPRSRGRRPRHARTRARLVQVTGGQARRTESVEGTDLGAAVGEPGGDRHRVPAAKRPVVVAVALV